MENIAIFFPLWKGVLTYLPKTSKYLLKIEKFHNSANKIMIQLYTKEQKEHLALILQPALVLDSVTFK